MSETAVGETTKTPRTRPAAESWSRLFLFLALAFVLGCGIFLYIRMPDRSSDFDLLYDAAARLLRGENPYPAEVRRFPYPLTAVLLAVPFTTLPLSLARPVFDVLVGWVFVYAVWRYRGPYALLAVVSGTYLFAMRSGQTTPLMVGASLVPALGFLLAVRPNTSVPLWIARPSRMALLGVSVFVALTLVVRQSWPWDWWLAWPGDNSVLMPPVWRPLGFILLLAALRWRSPEGRLLLAIALIPQTTLPYELVSLALIPANLIQMGIYVAGSWIAVVAAERLHLSQGMAEWSAAGWPVTLAAVYVPMLFLVLRPLLHFGRGESGLKLEKERRRPHRLPDDELKVDVSPSATGAVMVKVTHLPTQLFASESGRTRDQAERKAQDRLAAVVAERLRRRKKA